VVGTVAVAWLLGATQTSGTTTASPTRAAVATATPIPGSTPDQSAPPSPERTTELTLEPTSKLSAEPTTVLTPEPTTMLTPEPTTAPQVGLAIDFPADGEVVRSRVINVVGTAPPGSPITRDIPLWFDAHTTTRGDGIWMLPVELVEGENALTFRLGDDRSTEIRLTVTYRPSR
jgi:hypothetical protein